MSIPLSFEFDDSNEKKKRDAMTQEEYEAADSFIQTHIMVLADSADVKSQVLAEAFYKVGLWFQYHPDVTAQSNSFQVTCNLSSTSVC